MIRIAAGILLCSFLAGSCSSTARQDAATILAKESENLAEAWEIYRAATIPAPDLGTAGRYLLPEVESKITEAIEEMRLASLALASEEGAEGE